MLLKSLLLVLCSLVLIQGFAVPKEDEYSNPTLRILNKVQMAKFLSENPDAIKLNREVSIKSNSEGTDYDSFGLTWIFGARQTGDAVVYKTSRSVTWFDEILSPGLYVQYPNKAGKGKIVTYVTIETQQSTRFGDAYISGGGIGQRQIDFLVHGYETQFWGWDIKIYGKD